MTTHRRALRPFGAAALIAAAVCAQGDAPAASAPPKAPKFAAPIRLKAGDAFMGEKRLFPSPVFHDLNGDGLLDVVIGDLPGRLTVATRVAGGGAPQFSPETKIKGRDGKDLDFSNW